jgi:hypothetical protein
LDIDPKAIFDNCNNSLNKCAIFPLFLIAINSHEEEEELPRTTIYT